MYYSRIHEVEKILRRKLCCTNGRMETNYLLKWKNFDHSYNSWEPESNLDCDELLLEFVNSKVDRIVGKFVNRHKLLNILVFLIPYWFYLKILKMLRKLHTALITGWSSQMDFPIKPIHVWKLALDGLKKSLNFWKIMWKCLPVPSLHSRTYQLLEWLKHQLLSVNQYASAVSCSYHLSHIFEWNTIFGHKLTPKLCCLTTLFSISKNHFSLF